MITVPDSVAFYWRDAVNGAAVNVLAGSPDVPGDLALDEADRFELASLAARRIRVEYRDMLRRLWSAAWNLPVRKHLPTARLLSYGSHRAFADTDTLADPSVDHSWTACSVAGVFDVGAHGHLLTTIALTERDSEGELCFYLIAPDKSCAVTDDLDLGPDWGDDGDSRRQTRAGILRIDKAEGRINPEPFATLASGR